MAGKAFATGWGRVPVATRKVNFFRRLTSGPGSRPVKVRGPSKKFRSFEEARKFVRALGLKNHKEWRQYCQGKLPGRMPKPKDIPADSQNVYKAQGWQGLGDWLGTGRVAEQYKKFRSFEEARRFVHSLGLTSEKEWRQYCKGELKGMGSRPEDIPAGPARTYKDHGWKSFGDWLGTGIIATFNREYRSFKKARKFVRALGLKGSTEWRKYCQGKLPGRKPKPEDIPASPQHTYKDKGWQNMRDWLGN